MVPLDLEMSLAAQAADVVKDPSPVQASGEDLALVDRDTGQVIARYPAGHRLGTVVPEGGSACANCSWATKDKEGPICLNGQFVAWHGTGRLPVEADRYCCDLWSPIPDEG